MLYTEGDGLVSYGSAAIPTATPRILMRTTMGTSFPSPAGPWSAPIVVHTPNVPATGNVELGLPSLREYPRDVYWIYGAKAHPQFSKRETGTEDGELLVSFNVNSWGSDSPATSASFNLTDVYRPRFVRVRFHKVPGQVQ